MSDPTHDSRRRHRWPRAVLAVVLLGTGTGVGAYAMLRGQPDDAEIPHCTVAGPGGEVAYTLDPEQAANAATIEAVGSARALPERAITIAIATAMQESSLYNLDYGDRDSLGLFQQRPSQGWGTPEQIMDPVYAAGQFYDHLVEVPGYQDMPLTEAAQAVQRSAFPDAYAQHEPSAATLAAALTGREAAALNCVTGEETGRGNRPAEVMERMAREFGQDVGASGNGATVVVPVGDGGGAAGDPGRGWELAHWSVAHAAELGIERISLGNRVWEASRSADGWQVVDEADGETMASTQAELRLTVPSSR